MVGRVVADRRPSRAMCSRILLMWRSAWTRGVVLACSLGLGSCAGEDPCEPMCLAAADLHELCFESGETDWPSLGYADRRDYLDACHTWAWEMRLLVGDEVDQACVERAVLFEEGECADLDTVDWNEPP